jgi:hypothetical protein
MSLHSFFPALFHPTPARAKAAAGVRTDWRSPKTAFHPLPLAGGAYETEEIREKAMRQYIREQQADRKRAKPRDPGLNKIDAQLEVREKLRKDNKDYSDEFQRWLDAHSSRRWGTANGVLQPEMVDENETDDVRRAVHNRFYRSPEILPTILLHEKRADWRVGNVHRKQRKMFYIINLFSKAIEHTLTDDDYEFVFRYLVWPLKTSAKLLAARHGEDPNDPEIFGRHRSDLAFVTTKGGRPCVNHYRNQADLNAQPRIPWCLWPVTNYHLSDEGLLEAIPESDHDEYPAVPPAGQVAMFPDGIDPDAQAEGAAPPLPPPPNPPAIPAVGGENGLLPTPAAGQQGVSEDADEDEPGEDDGRVAAAQRQGDAERERLVREAADEADRNAVRQAAILAVAERRANERAAAAAAEEGVDTPEMRARLASLRVTGEGPAAGVQPTEAEENARLAEVQAAPPPPGGDPLQEAVEALPSPSSSDPQAELQEILDATPPAPQGDPIGEELFAELAVGLRINNYAKITKEELTERMAALLRGPDGETITEDELHTRLRHLLRDGRDGRPTEDELLERLDAMAPASETDPVMQELRARYAGLMTIDRAQRAALMKERREKHKQKRVRQVREEFLENRRASRAAAGNPDTQERRALATRNQDTAKLEFYTRKHAAALDAQKGAQKDLAAARSELGRRLASAKLAKWAYNKDDSERNKLAYVRARKLASTANLTARDLKQKVAAKTGAVKRARQRLRKIVGRENPGAAQK